MRPSVGLVCLQLFLRDDESLHGAQLMLMRGIGMCRAALQRQHSSILMCAVAAVPSVTPGTMLQQLQSNYVFVVGFWAWAAAQFMKVGSACMQGTPHEFQHVHCIHSGLLTTTTRTADLHQEGQGGHLGCYGGDRLRGHAVIALGSLHGAYPVTRMLTLCTMHLGVSQLSGSHLQQITITSVSSSCYVSFLHPCVWQGHEVGRVNQGGCGITRLSSITKCTSMIPHRRTCTMVCRR